MYKHCGRIRSIQHLLLVLTGLLLSTGPIVGSAAKAASLRRVCSSICQDETEACIDLGGTHRRCRRLTQRACILEGAWVCLQPDEVTPTALASGHEGGGSLLAPDALVATADSPATIALTWADNSTNEVTQDIERRRDTETDWSMIARVGANVTSFVDAGLASGATFYYRVRANSRRTTSPYSAVASATTFFQDGNTTTTFTSSTTTTTFAASVPIDDTVRLLQLVRQYENAAEPEKSALLARLEDVANQRASHMIALMYANPQAALDVALSAPLRGTVPPSIQPLIEEEVTLQGQFEWELSESFDESGASSSHPVSNYYLYLPDGRKVGLHFVNEAPRLLSGSTVRVNGAYLSGEMALDGSSVDSALTAAEVLPGAIVRRVAVILINFLDKPTAIVTPEQARGYVFTNTGYTNGSSAKFYDEDLSMGKMTMAGALTTEGDVFGWYTIPYYSTTCSNASWRTAGNTAAAADGFVASQYNSIIYLFPRSSCSFSGSATVGGAPGKISLNGTVATNVIAHEMGHNLGLGHASTYQCRDASGLTVAIGTSCTVNEYGDPFDVQGLRLTGLTNYHKGRLNWLDPANTFDVTTSGDYTLVPTEWPTTGIAALRIPRDVDSSGNVVKYYYLEYRRPYGFDLFGSADPVVNGVSLRLAPKYSTYADPWLIDTTPSTPGNFYDSAIQAGRVFEDTAKGITVATLSVSSSAAVVRVLFGAGVCARANPTLSVSSGQWGSAGEGLSYTLTIRNNDTAACGSSTFDVTATLPEGWVQSPSASSVTVSPGASAAIVVMVSSSVSAADGTYSFTETATNSSDVAFGSAASGVYNVYTADTSPPYIAITSPVSGDVLPKKGTVKVAATASDAGGISSIQMFVDGALQKSCLNATLCSFSWGMAGTASGIHRIDASARDGAGNTSTAQISVTK